MNMNINGNYIVNSTQSNLPFFIPEMVTTNWVLWDNKWDKFLWSYHYTTYQYINNSLNLQLDFGFETINAIELSEYGAIINITDNHYPNLHCDFMDSFPYTKSDTILLVPSCSYQANETIFYNNITLTEPIYINALVLWEINYKILEVSNQKLLNITSQPAFLRVAALDKINFEIIIATATVIDDTNNSLLRFRGTWTENLISVHQVETINFFTLNLNFFRSLLVDFKTKNSEIVYWYALDDYYGIRIIETKNSNLSLIVGEMPADDVISIGVCKGNFMLSKLWGGIDAYKIKEFVYLQPSLKYSQFANAILNYKSLPGLIQCSDDKRYIANKLFNNFNEFVIGIWDTKAPNGSNFISAVYISSKMNYKSLESLKFIDNNKISALGSQGDAYKSFEIHEKRLIFPKMNEEEYNDLVASWGNKEFSLYIIAGNGNNELSSQVVHFTRENNSINEKNYWWIWIILSIGIIGIAIGGYWILRKKLKAKKIRSLELILMKKCEHEIEEDIEFEERKE